MSMFIDLSLNVCYSFEGVAATPKEMVKKLTEKWYAYLNGLRVDVQEKC